MNYVNVFSLQAADSWWRIYLQELAICYDLQPPNTEVDKSVYDLKRG